MGFHEVLFPERISYGSKGGPGYNTSVVALPSGHEETLSRWNLPRWGYDVGFGVRSLDDLHEVIRFFTLRGGAANGFRYKDHADWASTANGRDDVTIPTSTDCQIGTGDGVTTQFQLAKVYSDGVVADKIRLITKPRAGTTLIAFDGVEQLTGFTVNPSNGVVTFDSAPVVGVVITAGFYFDVPVRFTEDIDKLIQASIDGFEEGSIGGITLVEVRNGLEIPDERWLGGGTVHGTITSNYSVSPGEGAVQSFEPFSAGLKVILPNSEILPTGGPYFYFVNESGTHSLSVEAHNGLSVGTIGPGETKVVLLAEDASSIRSWFMG